MPGKRTKHAHKHAGGKHHGSGKHRQPKIKAARRAHVVAKHPTHVTPAAAQGGH